jgi:hypothetical protein
MKYSAIIRGFVVLLAIAGVAVACAKKDPAPGGEQAIACKLDALTPAERQRQKELLEEVGRATVRTRETGDGYVLTLRVDATGFQRVAEWISLERRCCPFLNFNLKWSGGEENPLLELGGGPGVKAFLGAELARTTYRGDRLNRAPFRVARSGERRETPLNSNRSDQPLVSIQDRRNCVAP